MKSLGVKFTFMKPHRWKVKHQVFNPQICLDGPLHCLRQKLPNHKPPETEKVTH